jgi:hypothetical protein
VTVQWIAAVAVLCAESRESAKLRNWMTWTKAERRVAICGRSVRVEAKAT